MQMLYTKNRMLMVLALVGLMLFTAIPAAIAQVSLNGNVENDFNATYSIRIADNTGPQPDVALPGNFPPGTQTGWEMSEVRFYYDADTDRLYVGINSDWIVGDVDGDGDPAASRTELQNNAGSDVANLGNGEMVSVYFDIDQNGTYDLNAGVSRSADYSGFTVCRFSGSASNPGEAFGAAVPYHQGSVSPNPSPAAPDFEFYIAHFSETATTLGLTDANPLEFSINAFMGSGVDDGIGEDFLRLTPVSVVLAEIGDYVWDEVTVNGLQDAG
ncbi:hypothetical protein KAH55_13075, partial [bacterium]|nr:hypothetical protein [bacterium]